MSRPSSVPQPAHPVLRREPLPWQQPKPLGEETEVVERLHDIMEHPAYTEADRDADFLYTDVTRGIRLQLDYLKAEQILAEYGIKRCIVVLGSTRLREPETARRELAVAQDEVAAYPGDSSRARALRLVEQRLALSRYYEVGRELGRLVGATDNARLAVMTGGGPGAMEAANRGAFDVGAPTVGLNITLPHEQYPNPYVTPGLCLKFHYFALRKLHFMKRATAIVALPGGYGTLDELFGSLTLMQTRKIAPLPVVLVGEAYWRRVLDVDFLVDSGSIDEEDRELFWYAESAAEIWEGICTWHDLNGSPICNHSDDK